MISILTMGKFIPARIVTGGGDVYERVEVERKLPVITIKHVDKKDNEIDITIKEMREK